MSALLTGEATDTGAELFSFDPGIVIPEPATAAILSLAGLGVLLRKRHH